MERENQERGSSETQFQERHQDHRGGGAAVQSHAQKSGKTIGEIHQGRDRHGRKSQGANEGSQQDEKSDGEQGAARSPNFRKEIGILSEPDAVEAEESFRREQENCADGGPHGSGNQQNRLCLKISLHSFVLQGTDGPSGILDTMSRRSHLYTVSIKKGNTREEILRAARILLEEGRGRQVHMADIAGSAGISRQALYLHFPSRSDLMIAVIRSVNEALGLEERMRPFMEAEEGILALEKLVEVWGNFLPDIKGIARSLNRARQTDEDVAVAWEDCMGGLREACRRTADLLSREGKLHSSLPRRQAGDFLFVSLSVDGWEEYTDLCEWTPAQYVSRMKTILKRALLAGEAD